MIRSLLWIEAIFAAKGTALNEPLADRADDGASVQELVAQLDPQVPAQVHELVDEIILLEVGGRERIVNLSLTPLEKK